MINNLIVLVLFLHLLCFELKPDKPAPKNAPMPVRINPQWRNGLRCQPKTFCTRERLDSRCASFRDGVILLAAAA